MTLRNPSLGFTRSVETDDAGRFRFLLVPPCDCEVAVERLGYRPQRLLGVPVHAEERLSLSLALIAAPPPVNVVDTVRYDGAGGGAPGQVGGWLPGEALQDLPSRWRTAREAERLSSAADPAAERSVLAAPATTMSADGVPFPSARHPVLGATLEGAAFPLGWLQGARVIAADPDVEVPGTAGSSLQVFTRAGSEHTGVRAFGNWTGDALASSRFLPASVPGHQSVQGGLLVSGPALRDSASFAFGFEASREELALPPTLPAGDSLLARFATVAQQSYGVSLEPFRAAGVARQDVLTGFGRLGWQFSPTSRFDLRGSLAVLPLASGVGGPTSLPGLKGSEGELAATLSSDLSQDVSQELRVSADRSTREYHAAAPSAGTSATLAMTAFPVGSAPLWSSAPGKFTRSTLRASDALYVTRGAHLVKLGAALTLSAHDQSYAPQSAGSFAFGGVEQFAQGVGWFRQSVGAADASFTIPALALFAQDAWEVLPAFTVQLGMRYQLTLLPRDQVAANASWRTLTGLDNTGFKKTLNAFSPRLGVSWDVQDRHEWLVLGSLGLYRAEMDPAIVGELVSNDGRLGVRQGLGSLGSWPATPTTTAAPVVGQSLTLLSSGFAPARSTVGTLAVRRSLGPRTMLEISGTVRHTELLPRRRDLNLPAQPAAHDAHGRPIYGQLVQQGGLVAALPGSNRRFPEFDAVWALEATGKANQLEGTISLQHPLGPVRLLAGYTYSHTTDDVPTVGATGLPAPVTGDTAGGRNWVNGPADLDIPHRVALGATLQVPGTWGPQLSLLYRYRSGLPFTPSFRSIVDLDGDGVPGNEPAFLDGSVSGATDFFGRQSCLRTQVGRFAGRNSCRGPSVQTLDARAQLTVLRHDRFAAHVVVDGLNLLDADLGVVDPALFLIDATGSLASGGGTVSVPLVLNPDFGRVANRLSPGRTLRLGLQISY